jgi:hypothetical protein
VRQVIPHKGPRKIERSKSAHSPSRNRGPKFAAAFAIITLGAVEADMFVAIAVVTVAAVIAVYAISLWVDAHTP